MKNTFILGTRGSSLARRQTELTGDALHRRWPELELRTTVIVTKGDKILDHPLSQLDDKGLFTREIEQALLAGEIDAAVHSFKDLPTEMPEGLTIGAVLVREDSRDCLVSRRGETFAELPEGAVIGTGSPRRVAQILARRPDLQCRDIRGNLETRLRKLDEGQYDAIVLARAGLNRMGLLQRATEELDFDLMLPAPAQGAVAVQCRENDERVLSVLAGIDHGPTRTVVDAERAFLGRLEGGCSMPLGTHGRVEDGTLILCGVVSSPDGRLCLRDEVRGPASEPERAGREMGDHILGREEYAALQATLEET